MREKIPPRYEFSFQNAATPFLVGAELIFALLSGLVFTALGVGGGAWILGGIASGAVLFYFYRSRYREEAEPNRSSRKIGQILVGLTVGFAIAHSDLEAIALQFPIFILLTFFLLVSGWFIGYLYSRIEKTDLLTATLATVPGNIGVMASIAADYGRNTSLVSLIQLLRFTTVTLVIPLIANVSNSRDIGAAITLLTKDLSTFNASYLIFLCLVLAIAFLVIHLSDLSVVLSPE